MNVKEFVLFEHEECCDTVHPYGDITSDLWAYRLITYVHEDKSVLVQFEAGKVECEQDEDGSCCKIVNEWEACEHFDLHLNDMNVDELKGLIGARG